MGPGSRWFESSHPDHFLVVLALKIPSISHKGAVFFPKPKLHSSHMAARFSSTVNSSSDKPWAFPSSRLKRCPACKDAFSHDLPQSSHLRLALMITFARKAGLIFSRVLTE